jgi:hypothetical protein
MGPAGIRLSKGSITMEQDSITRGGLSSSAEQTGAPMAPSHPMDPALVPPIGRRLGATLLALVALLVLSTAAIAWGSQGHRGSVDCGRVESDLCSLALADARAFAPAAFDSNTTVLIDAQCQLGQRCGSGLQILLVAVNGADYKTFCVGGTTPYDLRVADCSGNPLPDSIRKKLPSPR